MLPHITPNQAKRFWAKVNKSSDDSCWEWNGKHLPKGYGQWQVQSNLKVVYVLAHRVAYFLATGDEPGDLLICHHCDNPPCCNPAHLYKGTQSDNRNDAYQRNRRIGYSGPRLKGQKHWSHVNPDKVTNGSNVGGSKLTEAQVIEIRKRHSQGEKPQALAIEFGMHPYAVYPIVNRKIWKHI